MLERQFFKLLLINTYLIYDFSTAQNTQMSSWAEFLKKFLNFKVIRLILHANTYNIQDFSHKYSTCNVVK